MNHIPTVSQDIEDAQDPAVAQEVKRYHAFINLSLFLAFVTSIEIVLIFLPFAKWVIISLLIFLSVVKFFCVILWFMHLIYDQIMLFLVFLSGLMIATGTITALMYLFSPADVDHALYTSSLEDTVDSTTKPTENLLA